MYVIGTAGHIDHGKTTLIHRLTGINPDRLAEEQARGMTIDLGFAWMELPSHGEVGIVDVPGHHRFLKNMLAGVSAVNLLLIVIAADDGWMPQTAEHVAIADLLGISNAVVCITKIDMVESDWLELVTEDVWSRLQTTSFAHSPLVAVSSSTGQNLDQLLQVLDQRLGEKPSPHSKDPLLWVDRVFSIHGSGTVVTGTLLHGPLHSGEEVVVEPAGVRARIRGLQTHQQKVERGVPGSRLAINLAGVTTGEVQRGFYVCKPHTKPHYRTINTSVQMLQTASVALEDRMELKLYVGTAEIGTMVKPLGCSRIDPGSQGYVQLRLQSPTHFSFRDRFILRHPAQNETLGGGRFLEEGLPVRGHNLRLVGPERSRTQFAFIHQTPVLDVEHLANKDRAQGPEEYAALLASDRAFWEKRDYLMLAGCIPASVVEINEYLLTETNLHCLTQHLKGLLADYHQTHRLSLGFPKETLRSLLGLPPRLFDGVLARLPSVKEIGSSVKLSSHTVSLTPQEQSLQEQCLAHVGKHMAEPPTVSELFDAGYPQPLVRFMIKTGLLIPISDEQVVTKAALETVRTMVKQLAPRDIGFSLSEFRDTLKTSRKHGLAYLEFFDERRWTKRVDDRRFWIAD